MNLEIKHWKWCNDRFQKIGVAVLFYFENWFILKKETITSSFVFGNNVCVISKQNRSLFEIK